MKEKQVGSHGERSDMRGLSFHHGGQGRPQVVTSLLSPG